MPHIFIDGPTVSPQDVMFTMTGHKTLALIKDHVPEAKEVNEEAMASLVNTVEVEAVFASDPNTVYKFNGYWTGRFTWAADIALPEGNNCSFTAYLYLLDTTTGVKTFQDSCDSYTLDIVAQNAWFVVEPLRLLTGKEAEADGGPFLVVRTRHRSGYHVRTNLRVARPPFAVTPLLHGEPDKVIEGASGTLITQHRCKLGPAVRGADGRTFILAVQLGSLDPHDRSLFQPWSRQTFTGIRFKV
jgi:hypothetical protein